jgi:hypothetical protein
MGIIKEILSYWWSCIVRNVGYAFVIMLIVVLTLWISQNSNLYGRYLM